MTTVTEDLDLPAGADPTNVTVRLRLAGTGGTYIEGFTDGGATLIHQADITPAADGTWSAELVANADITPAGTVWVREVLLGGRTLLARDFLTVPTSGTPTVRDCLTDPPGELASSALAAHLADPTDAHEASAIGIVDAGDYFTSTDVEGALQELGAAGGGGAAGVTDGDKGDVVVSGNGSTWTVESIGGAAPGTAAFADTGDFATAAQGDLADSAVQAGDLAAYQPTSAKDQPGGYAGLDPSGVLADAQIPSGITRDAELSAAVSAAINALLDGAPAALDTLNELAAAIGDDASFAATVTSALAGKVAASILTTDGDMFLRVSGAVTRFATTTIGRNILSAADAAAVRTLLALGSAALANTGDFDAAGAAAAAESAAEAYAVQRAHHTGTQPLSTISDVDLATAAPANRQGVIYDSYQGKWVPGPVLAQSQPMSGPLKRFHVAVGNKDTAALKIMFVGDSELSYACAHKAATKRLSVILNKPNRHLADLGPQVGTWYPGDVIWGAAGLAPIWTNIGTITAGQMQATRGMSGQALQLTDGQGFASTGPIKCDRIRFGWLAGNAGSSLDLIVDGVTVHTVADASVAGTYDYDVTPGTHTPGVISHGTSLFDFIHYYWGNASTGVQVWTAAKSGSTATNGNGWTDLAGYLASVAPHLVVIEWGINDYAADNTGATWYTQMSTFIDTVRANCDASIVIWLPSETANHAPWAVMSSLAKRLATAKQVALADASEVIPSMASVDTYSLSTGDKTHYSNLGGEAFSGVLLDVLGFARYRATPPVDGSGTNPAKKSKWQTESNNSGAYGTAAIEDASYGGMAYRLYANDGDTYPLASVESLPGGFVPAIIKLGTGLAAPDANVLRVAPNVWTMFGIGPFPMGLFSVQADANSPANTSENDLFNQNVPANLLTRNGDALDGTFFGVFANNTRTKRLKVKLGGQTVCDTTAMAFTGAATDSFEVQFKIVRQSATAVRCSSLLWINGTSTGIRNPTVTTLTGLTDIGANATALQFTATIGTGAASADVVLKAAKISVRPA